MTTEIKVPRGFLVDVGGPEYTPDVKLLLIDDGVLIAHYDDGSAVVLAAGQWKRLRVFKDPDYVEPEPVKPPAPEPVAEVDMTIEPHEGWLGPKRAMAFSAVMAQHDGDVDATFARLVQAGFEMTVSSAGTEPSDDDLWDAIGKLARRVPPAVNAPSKTVPPAVMSIDDIIGRA